MVVIRIGIGTALSLAVASCMQDRLDLALLECDLAQGELWRHSLFAALAAECVASASHVPVSPASFAASLLHDIGKLVIARNLSGDAATCVRRILEEGRSRLEAEVELCGLHHGALGGLIAEHWGLPGLITSGIAHLHLRRQRLRRRTGPGPGLISTASARDTLECPPTGTGSKMCSPESWTNRRCRPAPPHREHGAR